MHSLEDDMKTLEQITTELREAVERQSALTERFNATRVLLLNDGLTDAERVAIRADWNDIKRALIDEGEKIVRLRNLKADLKKREADKLFLNLRK